MENVFHFKLPYASKLTVTNFQSLVLLFHLAMSNKLKRIIHVSFLLNVFFHTVLFCVHIVCLCVCLLAMVSCTGIHYTFLSFTVYDT